jgi:hypothetical protein
VAILGNLALGHLKRNEINNKAIVNISYMIDSEYYECDIDVKHLKRLFMVGDFVCISLENGSIEDIKEFLISLSRANIFADEFREDGLLFEVFKKLERVKSVSNVDLCSVVEMLANNNMKPPESSINMIGTRLRDDELPLAIRMITGLCTARLIPPKNLFYSTLKLCKKVGDWETSVKILILMESYIRRGVSEEAYEACIDTCLSCNQHKAASAIISRMHIAGRLNVNLFFKT